jgi:hypothetical protein
MARPVTSAAARARQAEQAAERYAKYLESDPITPAGQFTRSPQAVGSQNGIGKRQVERFRARRRRVHEAAVANQEEIPEPLVITREQAEAALLIACNYVGEGGLPREALVIAAALGISRDVFAAVRSMLDEDDPDDLPAEREVRLYGELGEWLGEWAPSASAFRG